MELKIIILFIILSFIFFYSIYRFFLNKKNIFLEKTKEEAIRIIKIAEKEGDSIKKEKLLEIKEKIIDLKYKHEKEINIRENKIINIENKIREEEAKILKEKDFFYKKNKYLKSNIRDYEFKIQKLKKKEEEINNINIKKIKLLERISNYSVEEAREYLINLIKDEAKAKSQSYINKILEEAKLTAKIEARKIIIQAMQRIVIEQSIENTVSVFNIESDDIKGRIIGREGRNIRALEQATGVEIIIDDTPEAILLSCFNPMRREIARIALHKLVLDGRIHPARIEEVVLRAEKQIEEEVLETGKKTVIDLGIHGLHPELIKIIGKMKYRSSYGQNLLQHSREVANLASIIAAELRINAKIAKRAGLLHDIGKVPETDSELSHAILGMQWADKYGEHNDICNAIGAHHDEVEINTIISPIIQICDAISGARPGVRRSTLESYIKRLKDLEKIALSFEGVYKAFVLQAGRELRVIVESNKIDDNNAIKLSHDITEKIQNKMTYPGQIKVTVIREIRAIKIAK